MIAKWVLGATLLSSLVSAFALPITPVFTTFGSQPTYTFGGSGIPNDAVAVTNLASGVVLGLSATPRFSAPALSNNSAGSFTALAGTATANAVSLWNMSFYLNTGTATGRNFRLFYDFDPTAANDQSTHGVINFANAGGTSQIRQGSENLGFGYLAVTNPLFGVTAPAFTPFDKDAHGTYTFALVAYDVTGLAPVELGRSAISVSVVPEPEAYGLALAGMAVVGFFGLRRKTIKSA